MTTKDMIKWYEAYKGYKMQTMAKDAVHRRIISYLCNDIGYNILSGDEVRRIKAKTALTEYCKLTDTPYPI